MTTLKKILLFAPYHHIFISISMYIYILILILILIYKWKKEKALWAGYRISAPGAGRGSSSDEGGWEQKLMLNASGIYPEA